MKIQITPAIDNAPPPWCQSSTLLLDFPPLDEHVAYWQALNLNTASCQISNQYHFEAQLNFGSGSSSQYESFDLIGH